MSQVIHSSTLPSVMEAKLRAIRTRQALLAVARAVAIGAATLLAAMLAAMMVDWSLTLFHTGVRAALSAASLALAVVALLATGLRPLIIALGRTRAAASADEAAPQLEERWTTVASFAHDDHQPTTPTARAMLQQVTSEAAAMGRLVEPRRAAPAAAMRPPLLALLGCAVALSGFLALDWPQTSVLLQRFWLPLENITATQLNSVTGDVAIPRGESVQLVTELSGLPRNAAALTVRHESGVVDLFELQPDESGAGAFVHSLRVDDSFRYRVRAGDGQTTWHTVTAIDYPELGEVRFTITAPEYVDQPPYEKSLIPSRVRVVQGSRLELLMKPVAELERFELTLSAVAEEDETVDRVLSLEPDAGGWYKFETQLLSDISLRPTLVNSHGLTNQDKRTCRIQVIPDKAPVARVISPTEEMAVAVDDVIDVKFEAHDDHGIATAELVVYDESDVEGEEPKVVSVQEIPLGEQQLEKYVRASAKLDLKQLDLEPGANISYAVRVTDNRKTQFDPQALSQSTAEAKPGEPHDESRLLADAGDRKDKQSRGDSGKRDVDVASDSDDTRSPAHAMLAAADKPFSQADSKGESGKDETDRQAARETAAQDPSAATSGEKEETGESETPSAAVDEKQDANASASEDNAPSGRKAAADDSKSSEGEPQDARDSDNASSENPSSEKSTTDDSTSDRKSFIAPRSIRKPADNPTENASSKPSTTSDASNSDETTVESSPAGGKSDDPPADPSRLDDPPSPGQENASDETAVAAAKSSSSPASTDTKAEPGKTTEPRKTDSASDEDQSEDESPDPQQVASASLPGAGGQGAKVSSPPPSEAIPMNPQVSASGQNTETNRRKLKITERLTAVAEADDRRAETMEIRDRVVQIDKMLAAVEAGLTRVVNREIPDADRAEQFRTLDGQLGDVEKYIAQLHDETHEDQFAFVGLQMVDIGRSHVTPARDGVFLSIRDPADADGRSTDALQHVVRAREMLAALLKRYERVAREQELAESLDETVKMYEVYVEKMQQLMRQARQNTDPLKRKMAVIEVDQEYLDRYAEVLTLRREMLREFGRMLADDPRLLARYLDLTKRRRNSLRDQLSELIDRQEEIATELSGWIQVDETQRGDLWMLVAELRLHAATPLAKDAAELAERIEKQMPLALEPSQGAPALVIRRAKEVARAARAVSFDAEKAVQDAGQIEADSTLHANAEQLVRHFGELEAALDALDFEHGNEDEVANYVSARLLESRSVADQADAWSQTAGHIEQKSYSGLALIDQRNISIATELLRVEMVSIETDLEGQFRQITDAGVPGEIVDLVRTLHRVMEAVALNQTAATFAMTQSNLGDAELQQAKTLEGMNRAEELFDKIRRAVVDALDEQDVPDPNITDLVDPTLDEFLAQLEREPNIEAQLGLPNRPRNLRIIADTLLWQQNGADLLGGSGDAAMQRARQAMKRKRQMAGKKERPKAELTEQQREQLAKEKQMQDELAKALASIEKKADDPQASPQQRRKLEQAAEGMRRMLDELEQPAPDAQTWQRLAQSDQAKEILRALAQGETMPDQQWNKLLSTLEDGLWQVRGKTPPAEYRKAIEQYQDRIRQLTGEGE